MKNYKKIHIWDFPPTEIFVRIKNSFRKELFNDLINTIGSQQKVVNFINQVSKIYKIERKHSRLNLYSWIKGEKYDNRKIKIVNIPLWILLEISKFLSKSEKANNRFMKFIDNNVEFYTSWGNANPVLNPKLPIIVSPEFVSVICHFCGDGHIGKKRITASYKQVNKEGLSNFLQKLKNTFGDFKYSKEEFDNWRLNIPKVICDIYKIILI